ncbi:transposase [Burkholderia pseudomallei]|uniref:transposase n=1 Tax=Burkholderia pseudomallei TaxID=28450 RepID=UPI001177FFBA|nr:transposase [Burkholderia pseudomallei]
MQTTSRQSDYSSSSRHRLSSRRYLCGSPIDSSRIDGGPKSPATKKKPAACGNGKQFRSGRDLAAWIGLVPRQHTTGGKPTLVRISKRGNTYLCRLLVLGAQSCLMRLDRLRDRLGRWLDTLESRMHHNKIVIALANKLARVAWVVLASALPGTRIAQMYTWQQCALVFSARPGCPLAATGHGSSHSSPILGSSAGRQ